MKTTKEFVEHSLKIIPKVINADTMKICKFYDKDKKEEGLRYENKLDHIEFERNLLESMYTGHGIATTIHASNILKI